MEQSSPSPSTSQQVFPLYPYSPLKAQMSPESLDREFANSDYAVSFFTKDVEDLTPKSAKLQGSLEGKQLCAQLKLKDSGAEGPWPCFGDILNLLNYLADENKRLKAALLRFQTSDEVDKVDSSDAADGHLPATCGEVLDDNKINIDLATFEVMLSILKFLNHFFVSFMLLSDELKFDKDKLIGEDRPFRSVEKVSYTKAWWHWFLTCHKPPYQSYWREAVGYVGRLNEPWQRFTKDKEQAVKDSELLQKGLQFAEEKFLSLDSRVTLSACKLRSCVGIFLFHFKQVRNESVHFLSDVLFLKNMHLCGNIVIGSDETEVVNLQLLAEAFVNKEPAFDGNAWQKVQALIDEVYENVSGDRRLGCLAEAVRFFCSALHCFANQPQEMRCADVGKGKGKAPCLEDASLSEGGHEDASPFDGVVSRNKFAGPGGQGPGSAM